MSLHGARVLGVEIDKLIDERRMIHEHCDEYASNDRCGPSLTGGENECEKVVLAPISASATMPIERAST